MVRPKCIRLWIIDMIVSSFPPCCVAVELKAPPTLPFSAPVAHRPPAMSQNAAICDGRRPKRVPAPMMIAS